MEMGLKDVEQPIKLEDGKSFVGLYDPTKDVGIVQGGQYGTRYTFRFLNEQGRIVSMTGGSRLLDKIMEICGTSESARNLKITAKGRLGTMDRDYVVEDLSPSSKK